jgi:hypothetical protein
MPSGCVQEVAHHCRDYLGDPAAVVHVEQSGQQGGAPLDDSVRDLVSRAGGR